MARTVPTEGAPVGSTTTTDSSAPTGNYASLVSGLYDKIEAAQTISDIISTQGGIASCSLEMDSAYRKAESNRNLNVAAVFAKVRYAIDMAMNAANAKYTYLNSGSEGAKMGYDNLMSQKGDAIRTAQDADRMAGN